MSIEAIGPIGLEQGQSVAASAPATPAADFSGWLASGVGHVEHSLDVAETGVRALAAGRDVPVHEVMIALEQARLDLSLATEVRNRLVEAYQELARIQL
ncbi:TPA: flagellar hook-basal body complex protein FliE [Stenotrophomonas maltophilia]